MFRNLLKKLLSWLRELWSLFKAIDGAVSKESKSKTHSSVSKRTNALTPTLSYQSPAIRHRFVELEGYAENLRIDSRGRYDLRQLARFAENFVWISPDSVDDFITGGMDCDTDYIDGHNQSPQSKPAIINQLFFRLNDSQRNSIPLNFDSIPTLMNIITTQVKSNGQ